MNKKALAESALTSRESRTELSGSLQIPLTRICICLRLMPPVQSLPPYTEEKTCSLPNNKCYLN